MDDAKQVVVKTDGGMEAALAAAFARSPRPAVDFSKEMVVGVFLGSRPTAGLQPGDRQRDRRTTARFVVRYREVDRRRAAR